MDITIRCDKVNCTASATGMMFADIKEVDKKWMISEVINKFTAKEIIGEYDIETIEEILKILKKEEDEKNQAELFYK